ncbi:MAG TPA: 3-phosphoshikimate 1-carboxyvinyltransferase [Gemmatimonadaceae bacterium]|nr:3-phosphoshikimate 1-carboxyvinyltransferase [Gemmatimonadaceae bacterium]
MKVGGTIRVPGDKSISHRALIFAALAEGASRIRDILPSADVHRTASVLGELGVPMPPLSNDITIAGRGPRALTAPTGDLDCGNSGTTTRLVAGVAAALPFTSRFVGDASLSRRPMRRIAKPLRAMGATVDVAPADGLPMTVSGGHLHGITWRSEAASAQVKSAILLAGLAAGVEVTVHEPARSRDHTERMLTALGATVDVLGATVRLVPADHLAPLRMRVPADPSSAAFLAALAVLATQGELTLPDVCLNPTRTGFYAALARMGANLALDEGESQGGEPVGTVIARPSSLTAIELGRDDVPSMIDELPLVACLASRATGTTTIRGAEELRVKESDRIATVVANLRAVGVNADALPDGMCIEGSARPLRGRVQTHGDHRIAMAFGVLRALPNSEIDIDDTACVSVSYPGFWDDIAGAIVS